MSVIKVAVIGTRGYPSYYGGFETAVRHLIEDSTDSKIKYFVFSRKVNCMPNPNRENSTVLYTPNLNYSKLSTLSHIFFSIPKLLVTKPDVILAFNVSCGYILPLTKILRIPTILNVDGLEWKRSKWGRIAKLIFLGGAKMSAKYADQLICDSTEIATYWKSFFNRDSNYIPYGGSYSASISSISSLKPGYVLYVARFVPENHFLEFLKSLDFLEPKIPVVLVGNANGNSKYEELIESALANRKSLKYLGHINDDNELNLLWANCGVYFHGHSVGGTNPALVQAMSCSAPIVAFDSIYNREVLQDCGLFTSADPGQIADAMIYILNSPQLRESLGEKARSRADKNFKWEDVVRKYEDLIVKANS